MKISKLLDLTIIGANYCPDCGRRISPDQLHICGQFDVFLNQRSAVDPLEVEMTNKGAENVGTGWGEQLERILCMLDVCHGHVEEIIGPAEQLDSKLEGVFRSVDELVTQLGKIRNKF